MNAITYIGTFRNKIDAEIDTFFNRRIASLSAIDRLGILPLLRERTKQGKYVRSGLFLMTCRELGIPLTTPHFRIAAALETMQTALLVHDDIMDKDDTRRGSPSVPSYFLQYGREQKYRNPSHFALSTGICTGDIGIFLSFRLLSDSLATLDPTGQTTQYAIDVYLNTGFAQADDVRFSHEVREPSEEEIINLYRYKTANYSFSLPLTLAAMVAKQTLEVTDGLHRLGEDIGIVYQIRDDEIGLQFDHRVTGKPMGSDIRENKKTLIRTYLLSRLSEVDGHTLCNILMKDELTPEDTDRIIGMINEYRIWDALAQTKHRFRMNADKVLERTALPDQLKTLIRDLIGYADQRSS